MRTTRKIWTNTFISLAAAAMLAGCAVTPVAEVASAPVAAPAAVQLVQLPAGNRTVDVSVYRPVAKPLGVLFMSHGGNSSPARMRSLTDRLTAEGFVVLAPMHTDSLEAPDDVRTDLFAAFPTRIADLQAVSAYAAQSFPDLPYGAIGYSYGSLTSLIGVGMLRDMAQGTVPALKSAVTFSTPGVIPGMMDGDAAFTTIGRPTLLVTGTEDVVPDFVPDGKMHQAYFERAPAGGRMMIVVGGATHRFVGGDEPGFSETWPVVVDFLKATVLDDAAAKIRLGAAKSTQQIEISRR
ncbi:hypothetical protein [Altererythrobacter aquiaggeris]|uniref:hypothetical protein n=1 Tax=Aestuarierythrobacter aquiaggeris TaxID=1898396 RepID=UPI003019982B